MRVHWAMSMALQSGVRALTDRLIGTDCRAGGETTVTLGSSPRKAERRNLKPPSDTRRSVQTRTADLRNCCAVHSFLPRCRPCQRLCTNAEWGALITTSTSGTATPNALPLARLAPTKPVTSTPGRTCVTTPRTACVIFATTSLVSAVGVSWASSSCTSASQPWEVNFGASTGWTLGFQTSGFEGVAAGPLAVGLALAGEPGL
mmetsp:Transcript_60998/g.158289  ORF Transcript_60998/g.158289 Transcript_60998/m.158289 type:complete len:203 (+) Transcript_60998:666-1274(+)